MSAPSTGGKSLRQVIEGFFGEKVPDIVRGEAMHLLERLGLAAHDVNTTLAQAQATQNCILPPEEVAKLNDAICRQLSSLDVESR
jgi:hypothetical protein